MTLLMGNTLPRTVYVSIASICFPLVAVLGIARTGYGVDPLITPPRLHERPASAKCQLWRIFLLGTRSGGDINAAQVTAEVTISAECSMALLPVARQDCLNLV